MPITPFHLGPGLFFGIIFLKYLDLLAFLIGNVVVDIQPLLVVLYEQKYPVHSHPYHGFSHTILGAFLISLITTVILNKFQEKIRKIVLKCSTPGFEQIFCQNSSFRKIFLSVFLGTLLHIFFDAFTHYDVFPFWPITNYDPLLGLNSYLGNMLVCTILGILGIIFLVFYLKKIRKNNNFRH